MKQTTSPMQSRSRRATRQSRSAAAPLALLLWLCPAAARADGAAEPWRVISDRDGLTVASRRVPSSAIDEVRAVATFELPLAPILTILSDVEHYPGNLPPTAVARRLQGSDGDGFYYMEIKPSMVARRYSCTHSRVIRQSAGVVRVEWSSANQLCPERQDGMVRMEDNAGSWTLTAISDGRTRVVYQAHADPGGTIPASMVNWVTARTVPELLQSLQRAAARAQLSATR
jgi:hypothetical protein